MVKCICIDDSNKPKEIPKRLWVEKGKEYHITHIYFHNMQFISGCELKEKRLTKYCYPFESYKLSRFGFTHEALKQLIELMKACSELNEIDIKEMILQEFTFIKN